MGEQEGVEDPDKIDPSKKPETEEKSNFTKAQSILLERSLAAATAVSTIVAGILLKSSHPLSAYSFFGFAVACIAYALYLFRQHQSLEIQYFSKTAFATFAFTIMCCFIGFPILTLNFIDDEQVIVVTANATLQTGETITPTAFVGVYAIPNAFELRKMYAVQYLASFTIENESERTINPKWYTLEYSESGSTRGPWRQLCPVNTGGARLFMINPDVYQMVEIGTENFFDKFPSQPLKPKDTFTAWSGWSCSGTCSLKQLRFSIGDASGKTYSQIINQTVNHAAGLESSLHVLPGGRHNFSDFSAVPEPWCK